MLSLLSVPMRRCCNGSCRRLLRLVLGSTILCGAGAVTVADESPPGETIEAAVRDGFLAIPLRTELQRVRGSKYEKGKVFVLINGMNAIKDEDETLDVTELRLWKILKSIRPFAEGEPGNVVFRLLCKRDGKAGQIGPSPFADVGILAASDILERALRQLGRDAGFEDVHVGTVFLLPDHKYVDDWERVVRDVVGHPGGQDVDEPGVGGKQVKLYAVRTGLSRLLYRADCVVHYVPPITEVEVPSALETMRRCLPELQLEKKYQVVFLYKKGAPPELYSLAVDELIADKHVYRDLLGFESAAHMRRD